MGCLKHNAIVCTYWSTNEVKEVREKAVEIMGAFSGLVSPLIPVTINSGASFFIAPDGSKEGWHGSDKADEKRKEFLDWLMTSKYSCDYIEIRFGGDDDREYFVRSKNIDFQQEETF